MNSTVTTDVLGDSSSCAYSIDILDFRPPLNCSNVTQCEEDWPCELREFWMRLRWFVYLDRWLLYHGTIIIIVLGILLNSLSFYVLLSSGLARKGSGLYLVVLAICDTGNLIFNFAIGVARAQSTSINDIFMENEWVCRSHAVLVELFQLHSAWIVVGFTLERCLVVWYPLSLRKSKSFRSKVVVSTSGIVFTLFAMSKLFITGFEKDSVFGYPACPSDRYKWVHMVYIGIAFQTWIPTCIVFISNCLMFFKLKAFKRQRDRLTRNQTNRPNAPKDQRGFMYRPSATTPMLIAVSMAYLILVFPVGVVQTTELYWNWYNHTKPTNVQAYTEWMMNKLLLKTIRTFCFALYQVNFSINFFLYFASGVQFRLHLLQKIKSQPYCPQSPVPESRRVLHRTVTSPIELVSSSV